ncbi:MAG: PRC-barrel domain-containing protein [Methanobacteriaceae archaeon]
MRIKNILGKEVLGTDGMVIGKVSDIEFDFAEGTIKEVIISTKKNILANEELTLPYSEIKSMGDYVLLKNTIKI